MRTSSESVCAHNLRVYATKRTRTGIEVMVMFMVRNMVRVKVGVYNAYRNCGSVFTTATNKRKANTDAANRKATPKPKPKATTIAKPKVNDTTN